MYTGIRAGGHPCAGRCAPHIRHSSASIGRRLARCSTARLRVTGAGTFVAFRPMFRNKIGNSGGCNCRDEPSMLYSLMTRVEKVKVIERMLGTESKQVIFKQFGGHEKDTGSTEVQVALLTERIKQLTDHLRSHHKDYQCRRGLMSLVGHRRRLLAYLSREDVGRYANLLARLGLRR